MQDVAGQWSGPDHPVRSSAFPLLRCVSFSFSPKYFTSVPPCLYIQLCFNLID
jgi:hypothetical protein